MPEILTHKGFKSYDGVIRSFNTQDKLKIFFDNNQKIICTKEHRFLKEDNSFCYAKDLLENDILYNNIKVVNIEDYHKDEFVYDILNVMDTHSFYTNNIISHNCVYLDEFAFVPTNVQETFFSSVYPTISSGQTTKVIVTSTPNGFNLFYKIWHDSEEGRNNYVRSNVHWSDIPGRNEEWQNETIRNTSQKQFRVEFECVDGDTIVCIEDIDTGHVMNITMEDLYKNMIL
jgi:hypothetical protein